ncbi:hypothetical protein SDJN03_08783, partial [Cucurbita argyrosperma subsp. sororia]
MCYKKKPKPYNPSSFPHPTSGLQFCYIVTAVERRHPSLYHSVSFFTPSLLQPRTPASHPRVLPQPHQCRLPSFAAVRRRGPLHSSPTLSIFFQSLAVEVFWVGPTPVLASNFWVL